MTVDTREFVHVNGVDRQAAYEGTELCSVLAASPDWEKATAQAAQTDDPAGDLPEELDSFKRDRLDAIATDLGVDRPGDLPNKGAVIDAIRTAQAAQTDDPGPDPQGDES
jgi:hypothetical protein